MLQYTHKELPDSLISKFKKEVTNPSLQSYVLVQQQKYDKVSHKTIEHPESLMPNAPLEGQRESDLSGYLGDLVRSVQGYDAICGKH